MLVVPLVTATLGSIGAPRRIKETIVLSGLSVTFGLCLATAKGEVRVEPLVTRKAERIALGGGLLAIGSPGRISLYDIDPFRERDPIAVSYTHLTLPTILRV